MKYIYRSIVFFGCFQELQREVSPRDAVSSYIFVPAFHLKDIIERTSNEPVFFVIGRD